MPKTTKAGVTVMVQMGVVMGASMIPEKKVPVSVVHPECNEVGEVEAVVKPIEIAMEVVMVMLKMVIK